MESRVNIDQDERHGAENHPTMSRLLQLRGRLSDAIAAAKKSFAKLLEDTAVKYDEIIVASFTESKHVGVPDFYLIHPGPSWRYKSKLCRIRSPSYLYKSGYKMCMHVYLNRDSTEPWTEDADADVPLFSMIVENIELALKLKRQLLRERLSVSFKFVWTKEGYEDVEVSDDDLNELRRQGLKERLREFLWRQKALRQEKLLECNSSTPLDVRWLEFQSLLLLAYGDVESNPGPLTSDELEKITNSILSEDDYFEVFTSVNKLCAKWRVFCLALGLPPSLLSSIKEDHNGDAKGCLCEGLISWLQQSYNIDKHGLPSWRRLVKAVDHPAGGDNHALALKIAKDHKQSEVLVQNSKEDSVAAPIPVAVCSNPKKSQAMSTAFANMYRAISRLLQRSVQAVELEEFLQYFCHPQSPRQLCVDPRVYEGATSTKDILKKLCPEYINPAELFVLEGIVKTFGSRRCKKLLRDFQDEFC